MAIVLTESAADHVRKSLTVRGEGVGLRLGVKSTGCSGKAYVVDYADEVGMDDQVFESHGVKVLVARENLAYLNGLELDYGMEGINESFIFHNPNVKTQCGCGESFGI